MADPTAGITPIPGNAPERPESQFVTVEQHIMGHLQNHPAANSEFIWLISAITLSTKIISSHVHRAGLIDIWGATGDENVQGETVQKLDRIANDTLEKNPRLPRQRRHHRLRRGQRTEGAPGSALHRPVHRHVRPA